MCAKIKRILATGYHPWATFQGKYCPFFVAFDLRNGANIAKKRVQQMTQFSIIFRISLGQILETLLAPKPIPEPSQKLDPNWTKK